MTAAVILVALTVSGQPTLPWSCDQVRAFVVSHTQEQVQAMAVKLTRRQREAVLACLRGPR